VLCWASKPIVEGGVLFIALHHQLPSGLIAKNSLCTNASCGNIRCRADEKCDVGFWPILLQKSKVAGLRIFAKNPKREAVADSYNLNRAAEVAYEFSAQRRGPSHIYRKSAPVALRIFEHQCKTTFATQSALN
jgi:hypothetical protein